MHLILAEQIHIAPERIRQEFDEDAIVELAESIASRGLMNPVTLRKQGADIFLVAGERRMRAILRLHAAKRKFFCDGSPVPLNNVPFLWISELDEIAALEAELDENVKRRDLTWQEQAVARKKLLDLRRVQAEARGVTYGPEELAKELQASGVGSSSARTVFRQVAVANFLDKPEVAKAGSLMEALKVAKKESEKFLLNTLGDMLGDGTTEIAHQLIVGDSVEELPKLAAGLYDVVCTDPPYGIDIQNAGSMVTAAHHYNDSFETLARILKTVPQELFRITRPQAHLYWFCDFRYFQDIRAALIASGWTCYSRPIIWWKRGKAMAPDITRWPKQEYECIIYGIKGDMPPMKVAGDVISTPYGSDLQQAEKPRELYVELLSRSVMPGSRVIDPFCGSGVIFSAADALKCAATGIELDKERAELAKIRAFGI